MNALGLLDTNNQWITKAGIDMKSQLKVISRILPAPSIQYQNGTEKINPHNVGFSKFGRRILSGAQNLRYSFFIFTFPQICSLNQYYRIEKKLTNVNLPNQYYRIEKPTNVNPVTAVLISFQNTPPLPMRSRALLVLLL